MSTAYISFGAGILTPTAVTGHETSRESGNVVHPILGRAEADVTLRPAGLRRGTLHLVFDTEAESAEAEDAHCLARAFTLGTAEDAGGSSFAMSYVTVGAIGPRRRGDAGEWLLDVDFQEVAAS